MFCRVGGVSCPANTRRLVVPGLGRPSSVTSAVSVTGEDSAIDATASTFKTGGAFGVLLTSVPVLFLTSTSRSTSHSGCSQANALSVLPFAVTVQITSRVLFQSFGTVTLNAYRFILV